MDRSIRSSLTQLKDVVKASSHSDVPDWVREMIAENVSKLLDADASGHEVVSKLVGGLRVIADASSPGDDDPIVSRIASIIDDARR